MRSDLRAAALQPVRTFAPAAAEFFAGIGLARIGLEDAGFDVVWANDIEAKKQQMYTANFTAALPHSHFELGDVAQVSSDHLPEGLSLAWASFPCTDLSLAGARAGLAGSQSGTFWQFTRILREMRESNALPPVVALENVVGLATSHGGDDLGAAIAELNSLGYSVDALTLDARRFVPQSRPRLFLVAALDPPDVQMQASGPNELRPDWLQFVYSDPTLVTHQAELPPPPAALVRGLGELLEDLPSADSRWWPADRAARFIGSLSPLQSARLAALRSSSAVTYRTAYRRTRAGSAVWEMRADDISGCLRTARGGSSKQAVLKAGRGNVQVRWMTPREYARLMGAGEYVLDNTTTNQALSGFGDAVCVPVVSWLARHYLLPLVRGEFARCTALRAAGIG